MQGTESIEEAILEQARKEAAKIVREANMTAERILKDAEQEKSKKLESIRLNALEEANAAVEQMWSKANIEAKRTLQDKKGELLTKLAEHIRITIEERQLDCSVEESIKNLLLEALQLFPHETKIRVFVNPKDLSTVKMVLEELKLPHSPDIKPRQDILGGVIVESFDGLLRIDNSYDTRLNNYMQSFLPEIIKILFES